ncbi:MAG: hypothetical protein WA735_17360 [Candidatus Acidiferrales bacterium]
MEEETSVLVIAGVGELEQYKFWAKCSAVSAAGLTLSGDFVTMQIPLDSAQFEFVDVREAPEPIKTSYANFESFLNIKRRSLAVGLMTSATGSPVPILPPDRIDPADRS